MYVSVEELCGCDIRCRDGLLGQVQDVVFSRSAWRMRYAVVDTGADAGNLHVLLLLTGDERVDLWQRRLTTLLACRELEWAAPYDSARPLTRRQERIFAERYGWPSEWLKDDEDAAPLRPLAADKPASEQEQVLEQMLSDGPETQSAMRMIASFTASTCDRQTASVRTLIVNTEDWSVPYLAVKLSTTARPVVVPTHGITGIDWLHKQVHLAYDANRISRGPRYTRQLSARTALMRRLSVFRTDSSDTIASIPDDRLTGVPAGRQAGGPAEYV